MPKVILSETKPNSFIINKLKLFIMKKTRFFIATLLVVAAVSVAVVSCKKENTKALPTSNAKEAFDPRQIEDMNAYLKDFKQKMQSATKGEDETLSIEDADWHLEAVLNYTYGDAGYETTDIQCDAFLCTISTNENEITLAQLNELFDTFSNNVEDALALCDLPEKSILAIQTKFENDSINENCTVQMVARIRGLRPINHIVFDETDYWYEYEYGGKCGPYAGECWEKGATTELTRTANYRIPLYGCREGYRTYLHDIRDGLIHIGDQDEFLEDENSPSGYKVYERHTVDGCIPPDEMNYYLSKSMELLLHYTPNGKVPISCEYHWDELVGFDKNRSGECHFIEFQHAFFECVPDELDQ